MKIHQGRVDTVFEDGGGWHFCQGGGPAKKPRWVKQASLVLSRQKKHWRERQREWIAAPYIEGLLANSLFELTTAVISSLYPGADIALRGYNHKNLQTLTSYSNHFTLRQKEHFSMHQNKLQKRNKCLILNSFQVFSKDCELHIWNDQALMWYSPIRKSYSKVYVGYPVSQTVSEM